MGICAMAVQETIRWTVSTGIIGTIHVIGILWATVLDGHLMQWTSHERLSWTGVYKMAAHEMVREWLGCESRDGHHP